MVEDAQLMLLACVVVMMWRVWRVLMSEQIRCGEWWNAGELV